MITFSGLTPEEITRELNSRVFSDHPLPAFRGRQIHAWFCRGAEDFRNMTDLSPSLRETLQENARLYSSRVESSHPDPDGTLKLRIALEDGLFIESVLLQDQEERKTACLSSQAGCAMGCAFCRTGEMGLLRDLTPGEIVEQFYHLERAAGEIGHIVFMGMGEPLDNYEAFIRSVELLSLPAGKNMSPRRMTVSTCGLVPGIARLAESPLPVRLAVSLNSARQEVRETIMPVARSYPLPRLKEALLAYQERQGKRITLEYVLLGGVNDGKEDLEALWRFVHPLKAVVNLIPWNPVSGSSFSTPGDETIRRFMTVLEDKNIPVTRRFRRGRGINGACGQLATGI